MNKLIKWATFAIIVVGTSGLSTASVAGDNFLDPNRPHVCDQASGPRQIQCRDWIANVLRPDTRTSCCGDGDSYIVDDFEVVNGDIVAIVSVDYPPDDPHGIKKGQRILIPKNKINTSQEDAGVHSHGVVFLTGTSDGQNPNVLCYFFPPLT